MKEINNPAYKFYIKVNNVNQVNVDYYSYGVFNGNMNMNHINYYPYENFNGLTLNEIRSVLQTKNITLVGAIDVTKVTDIKVNVLPVWSKEITLNDSEQSINEVVASQKEDHKVYQCFVDRYCQKEQKEKVKEKEF